MADGDIYRWRFKEGYTHGIYGYHCKSCIAIERNGVLYDDFWGSSSERYVVDRENHELTYVANYDDLKKVHRTEYDYYRDADCVDLTHSNSMRDQTFILKEAKKCPEKMRKVIEKRIEDAERDIKFKQSNISRWLEHLEMLEQGKIDEVYI